MQAQLIVFLSEILKLLLKKLITKNDVDNRCIHLDSNAKVELTGNAGSYRISVKNALDVSITLNNHTAITGGFDAS
jgi:hypothetical protein